jgi:hypothetical protein
VRLLPGRRDAPPADALEAARLPKGDRVLAHAAVPVDEWLLATRRAFVAVSAGELTVRLPWEEVQAAEWDRDEGVLSVSEVGEYGAPRASYRWTPSDPERLLRVVRERVTASIVLQRAYPVRGKTGFRIIGRRPPEGGDIRWMHEYDEGIDPADPEVARLAAEALARARADVGEPI